MTKDQLYERRASVIDALGQVHGNTGMTDQQRKGMDQYLRMQLTAIDDAISKLARRILVIG